jgi:hypothetical protein
MDNQESLELIRVGLSYLQHYLTQVPVERNPSKAMFLSAGETRRALAIKQAAAAREHLKPLTDFEYAQFALATMDEPLEAVLQRIEMLQAFREEYHVLDTAEEGIRLINQMTLDHPGFLLAIEYIPTSGNYHSILDLEGFNPSRIKTPDQFRRFVVALYYQFQSKHSEFWSARAGTSIIAECMGVTTDQFDDVPLSRIFHELYQWYPQKQKNIFILNSNSAVNLSISLWRRHMTPTLTSSIQLGCQIPGLESRKIDILYKIPTPAIARQTLLEDTKKLLETRYHHERKFQFPA